MKKKYRWFLVLAFSILIIFCCVRFFSKGHTITYKVGEEKYEVKEVYTRKAKKEIDNYYLEITVNKHVYPFQFYHTFSKKRKVVEEVLTYAGDYECVLPIIEGKAVTDLLCYRDNRYYFYHSIMGEEEKLDAFVNSLDINLYDKDDWLDQSTDKKEENNITLYTRNVVSDHVLFLSNMKGIYKIDNAIQNINIFEKDIYQRDLSALVSHYYVVANYEENGRFRTFYFTDLRTGKISEAKAPNYLSFDSYIQGIVDNKLYIYDRDNEKQYRINPDKKKIEEIGNAKKKIQYYQSGKWSKITTTKANKEMSFEMVSKDLEFQKFDTVYHVGGKVSGYYYLLEKTKDGYNLYRTPSQNKKLITYITTIHELEDLFFLDDYVYFQEGNKIKYYQDETGIRTLLEYSELEFNKNILFGAVKK